MKVFVVHPSITEKRDQIVAACQKYAVARLEVFGSGARGYDFDPTDSDADFLVAFAPGADHYYDLKETFEHILGRHIDLIDRSAIEISRNYIRRRRILSEAQPLYVA